MILAANKPTGITSHDVVNHVRKITGEKRVGHGGTLDPFANGVLVIAIGRESTKRLQTVLKDTDKSYIAKLILGKVSSTGDPEGTISPYSKNVDLSKITPTQIEKVLEQFKGEITQTPPAHSAIKINGTPAYKLARKGVQVEIAPRKVLIKSIKLLEFNPPEVTISTTVSSGTYIRTLAADIGTSLGTGAYLKSLTRTKVGPFSLSEAHDLNELKVLLEPLYNKTNEANST